MLFTCPRCHYTFPSAEKPNACPDCGHNRVLPSSDLEFNTYYNTKLSLLREDHASSMTMDERNWSRVLLFLNPPKASFYTASHLKHYVLEAEPTLRLDTYKAFRWEFSRRVKDDRIALQLEGHREPKVLLRLDDGTPVVKGWEFYGAALRLLYSFELEDEHKVPNLGTINRIGLDKIAESPSPAYDQFLWDWIEAVKDVPSPMDGLIPELKPFLRVIKGTKRT